MLQLIIICLGVVVLFAGVTLGASFESGFNRMKAQPFECGFESFSLPRISFSLKFFMTIIIFLVFDVEIVLVLIIPVAKTTTPFNSWSLTSHVVIIVLILGLAVEWWQGALSWVD